MQRGFDPSDWKPMSDIDSGVGEIRIHIFGEWRIIYVAKLETAILCCTLSKRKPSKRLEKTLNWQDGVIVK